MNQNIVNNQKREFGYGFSRALDLPFEEAVGRARETLFAKGDQVEVIGSKVKGTDTEVVIAREVKKDGKVLTLRNAQGIPAWRRGGQ
jgi:hypothetical protein